MTIVRFRMPVGLKGSIFKLTLSQIFKFPSGLAERSRRHFYFSKRLPELISIWRNYIPAWRKERGDLGRNDLTIVKFQRIGGLQSPIFKSTNSQILKFPSSLAERSRSHFYFSKWLPELISIWRNYKPAWRKERGDLSRNNMTIVGFRVIGGLMRLIFKWLEY